MGQLVVLNAHPVAPTGPLNVPEGNRRSEFAAAPDGRTGGSGKPEIQAGAPDSAGAGGSGTSGPAAGRGGSGGGVVGWPPPYGDAEYWGCGPPTHGARKTILERTAH